MASASASHDLRRKHQIVPKFIHEGLPSIRTITKDLTGGLFLLGEPECKVGEEDRAREGS